jgi:hypothetical protein
MNLFIFYHCNLRPIHIFVLQKSIVKSECTFIEKNYIGIFIIKLLMYNQFQILNLISFIICYKCPKKGHFLKMGTMTQKINHLNVHSPWIDYMEVLDRALCYHYWIGWTKEVLVIDKVDKNKRWLHKIKTNEA